MQNLEAYFHYRVGCVDPEIHGPMGAAGQVFRSRGTHQVDDIRESIAELKHYRQHFLSVMTRKPASAVFS
jgi:oligoribonuclease